MTEFQYRYDHELKEYIPVGTHPRAAEFAGHVFPDTPDGYVWDCDQRRRVGLPPKADVQAELRRVAAALPAVMPPMRPEPDVLNPAYVRDVLSNPDDYHPDVVWRVRTEAAARGDKITHVDNPDIVTYIIARSATSDTPTAGVCRGLPPPDLPPKVAARVREQKQVRRERASKKLGQRKPVSAETKQAIRERLLKGQTQRYVAARLGVAQSTVCAVAKTSM
ncbi:TPA: hypothetical protein QHU28_000615 [Enterobacter hormaechei subsp. steigerwaltii]|uniref:hypothetical protein n=1 Tax=Enterobacter cloacae complex TaxID=354276 RepID=UPI00079A9C82|nr:hypothetical protein [Enterobacter hormaechei]HDS6539798.1 hypothetical protein [Enterobacter hormaechei subsp. steigerwaltii]CZZ11971.1 Uncharacterised protein [Enterobacter hormaechei]CZZ12251.1 Uncharacterised protein [Enterobacter hormaechei]CZZ34574.1 Uncharacterised protein [Enterobacter hormaechei]SAF76485.1 Uncharacterised protein [Enterobacter hormaechei]